MFEKLVSTVEKYDRLEYELANNPALLTDAQAYAKAIKEYHSLTPVVEKYREYKRAESDISDALAIIEEADDDEMRELAQAELKDAKARLEVLSGELTVLLLPRDPNDDKNIIVEIRAGAGGEEAALFAAVLYRMYSMYAAAVGFKVTIANANETELGGYKEICFTVEGVGAYSRLNLNRAFTEFKEFPKPSHKVEFRPLPQL